MTDETVLDFGMPARSEVQTTNIRTPVFRVAAPLGIFRPYKNKRNPNAQEKYMLRALFKHPDKQTPAEKAEYTAFLAVVKKAMKAVASAKWGTALPSPLRTPFRNQKEKENYDGYEPGAIFASMSVRAGDPRPGLVNGRKNNADITEESEFYAGCYARASINVYPYEMAGNAGIALGLNNVQKVADGETLSGRMKPQEEFEPVEDEIGDEAETGAAGVFDVHDPLA